MKVTVKDFQSIKHAEIDATGLTVIVGPSDRGKSALIRAIEGALFNRGGDSFVRHGASHTEVSIELAGNLNDDHTIVWRKGGGKNSFTVDSILYDKVGSKAPDVLPQLGFKDVLIGARQKDDGKTEGGEWLRLQVAHQWEGPFLLDKTGSFLNEVMVRLSRLGVLQRAGRQCSLDLRQAKQLLTVRRDDLTVKEAQLARLAPVVQLRDRVSVLQADAQRIAELDARVSALTAHRQRRADLTRQLSVSLPPPSPPLPDIDRYLQLRALRVRQVQLAPVVGLSLPPSTFITVGQVEAFDRLRMLRLYQLKLEEQVSTVTAARANLMREEETLIAATGALKAFQAEHPTCPVCDKPW